MKCSSGTNSGFTLVEIIVVMILIGIVATVAGTGLVQVVQGMIFTKKNATTVQKGQVAITKLIKEFNNINAVTATDTTSIDFTSYKRMTDEVLSSSHTVARAGNTITLDGDIITDQVSNFSLHYYDDYDSAARTTWQSSSKIIEINLELTGAGNIVSQFQERVRPRNLP
jgi:prepilin-type N-terminal cleavage/methylation domain-containing protein